MTRHARGDARGDGLRPARFPIGACRAGYTLVELALVLALVGACTAVAAGAALRLLDRSAVRAAATDVAMLLATAREAAMTRGATAVVQLDRAGARVVARVGDDTLMLRELARLHGVALAASRDSLAWSPIGMARGAANLRIVVRRGAAAETLTVSRLGRVR